MISVDATAALIVMNDAIVVEMLHIIAVNDLVNGLEIDKVAVELEQLSHNLKVDGPQELNAQAVEHSLRVDRLQELNAQVVERNLKVDRLQELNAQVGGEHSLRMEEVSQADKLQEWNVLAVGHNVKVVKLLVDNSLKAEDLEITDHSPSRH